MSLVKTAFEWNDSEVTRAVGGYMTDGKFLMETSGYAVFDPYNAGNYHYWVKPTRIAITTDEGGVQSLGFTFASCTSAEGSHTDRALRFQITTTTTTPSSGWLTTDITTGGKLSGSIENAALLPNTTYYLWFTTNYACTVTGTLTLTPSGTYGKPGDITANDAEFGGTVTMGYAADTSGATYDVSISIPLTGGSSQTETLAEKTTSGALTWTPSLETYAPLITDAARVQATITVSTYYGTNLSGTRTATIALRFPSSVAPTADASAATLTPYNTGKIAGLTGYIQNYSRVQASFDASKVSLKYGATLAKWTLKVGSNAAEDAAASASAFTGTPIVSAAGALSVTASAVDSRGFVWSRTVSVTVIPYQNPTITCDVIRCDENGDAAADGLYMRVTAAVTYAAIATDQNTISVMFYSKYSDVENYGAGVLISNGGTTVSGTNKTFSPDQILAGFTDRTYNIRVVATDKLGNAIERQFTVASDSWALHFHDGGDGAAFGKAAERSKELDIDDWDLRCGNIIIDGEDLGSLLQQIKTQLGI